MTKKVKKPTDDQVICRVQVHTLDDQLWVLVPPRVMMHKNLAKMVGKAIKYTQASFRREEKKKRVKTRCEAV